MMYDYIEQGDCLELMKQIPNGSVDMVLCDLPYGVTRNKWDSIIPFKPLWEQYKRVIKHNGAIVLFGSGIFTTNLIMSAKDIWKYNLIWNKTQPTGFLNANKMPLRAHEDICVFYRSPPTYNPQMTDGHARKVSKAEHKVNCRKTTNYGRHMAETYDSTLRYPTSVLVFPKDIQKSKLHPTQKPVALLEYLIKTYTNPGETVLDNCMGSGSTCVAAVNTGRHYIGFEIDPTYFDIACRRLDEAEKVVNVSE